jgi:hypothetical protein
MRKCCSCSWPRLRFTRYKHAVENKKFRLAIAWLLLADVSLHIPEVLDVKTRVKRGTSTDSIMINDCS